MKIWWYYGLHQRNVELAVYVICIDVIIRVWYKGHGAYDKTVYHTNNMCPYGTNEGTFQC